MRSSSLLLGTSLMALAAACGGSAEVGRCESGLRTENRFSTNRLAANHLTANRLAANRLAGNRLASNRLTNNKVATNRLANNELSNNAYSLNGLLELDAEDELFVKYLVECALDEQQTTDFELGGATKSFRGAMGLAPAWLDRGLDDSERRWVSACLLARTNAFGISVQISLAGTHPRLTRSAEEQAQFSVFEGAFYGNLFDGGEPVLASCAGDDRSSSPDGDLRVCTELDSNQCGFASAGACQTACTMSDDGALVTACERTTEVITVYLRADDAC